MANPFAKSKTFHKIGNFMAAPMWTALPVPKGMLFLTMRGRKTGRVRKVAMRGVRVGDSVYAVALLGRHAAWLHNVAHDAKATIKLGARQFRATAREISDPDERERARAIYLPVAGWYDYADYVNYVWDFPTRRKLERAHERWFDEGVPVVFTL